MQLLGTDAAENAGSGPDLTWHAQDPPALRFQVTMAPVKASADVFPTVPSINPVVEMEMVLLAISKFDIVP